MPRIPVYQQQTTPSGSSAPGQTYSGVVDGALSGLSSAIQRGENAQDQLTEVRMQNAARKERSDQLSAAHALISTRRAEWYTRLNDAKTKAPPGAKDFTPTFLKDFDKEAEADLKNFTHPDAVTYFRQAAADRKGDIGLNAMSFEAAEGFRFKEQSFLESADRNAIALRANPGLLDGIVGESGAMLDNAGFPAGQRAELWAQTKDTLGTSAVTTLLEQNPWDLKKRLSAAPGESGLKAIELLSAKRREALSVDADQEIRRREAEARARAAEARTASLALSAAIKEEADDALQRYSLGFGLPPNFGQVVSAVGQLPADDPRREGIIETLTTLDHLDKQGFLTLNPAGKQAWVTNLESQLHEAERQGKPVSDAGLKLLKVAKDSAQEANRRAKDDPVRFAIESGQVKPVQPAGNDLKSNLVAVAATARQATAFYGKPTAGMTAEGITALADMYDKASIGDRMDLLGTVSATHGQVGASVLFNAIDKQGHGVMALAGILHGKSKNVARLVVNGQEAIKNTKGLVPTTRADYAGDMGELLGDSYGGIGSRPRASIESAVLAAYAGLSAKDGDTSGKYEPDRLRQAVELVSGNMVMHRGSKMPAPVYGATQAEFSSWVSSIDRDAFANAAMGADYAFRKFQADGQLKDVGEGRFGVMIPKNDGEYDFIRDKNKKPLTIAYKKTKPTSDPQTYMPVGVL